MNSSLLHLFGATPYQWQQRLLNDWFLKSKLPAAIDIPTGLGKTKVIAAWLVALLSGAALPRRLVYVVDRRVVVDQATTEAQQLVERLSAFLSNPALAPDELGTYRKRLGLEGDETLPISTLRGQFIDNRRWMARPFGAAIVVGTIDMIGSRLLFSGYGVSRGMRPAHAGLLGCDALVVLDEAHLVPPFEALLERVVAMTVADREKSGGIIPSFELLPLSATGKPRDPEVTFTLDSDDLLDDAVQKRLHAQKHLVVHDVVPTSELSERLMSLALERAKNDRRVIVFCNSRKMAQDVESKLASNLQKTYGKNAVLTELLVGERRIYERLRRFDPNGGDASQVFRRFIPGAEPSDTPAFLIATSAGEVGVDLDADDLVCDLVPWERMVQRFGRVNRRATPGVSGIDIVPSVSEKDAEDPVAAERLTELLAPFAAEVWPRLEDATLDASPAALRVVRQREAETTTRASTPSPFHPELDRPTIDALALTSLKSHTGRMLVQPFLRGWTDDVPQASMIWRRYFPLRDDELGGDDPDVTATLRSFFDVAPPQQAEVLEAPVFRIVEVLKKRADAYHASPDVDAHPGRPHEPIVVVLDERNEFERLLTLAALLRELKNSDRFSRDLGGRTLVVDARLGGLSPAGLLDSGAAEEPVTLDDGAWQLDPEASGGLRIRWGVINQRDRVESEWKSSGFIWRSDPDADDGPALTVELLRKDLALDGDPAIAFRSQALDEHHEWTGREAQRASSGLGFDDTLATMLRLAAINHDAGKARELWQNAMGAEIDGRPYAKTRGGATPRTLSGYRHEFGSLGEIVDRARFTELPDELQDLAMHLVAAHHGHARPTITPYDPEAPPSRSFALARDVADRFARLQKHYGPWGLAWLETILRAADWAASEKQNRSTSETAKHA